MSRLIIHAGIGKTGTSSIQSSMHRNREALRSQGIRYIESNRPYPEYLAKHKFRWNKQGAPEWDELREEAGNLAGTCETVVVSNETLWRKNEEELRFFRDFFPGYEFTILLYVREQAEYLESRILQAAKSLSNRWSFDLRNPDDPTGIDEFLETHLPELDFVEVARRWGAVFGEENIHGRLYSRNLFPGKNVVEDFYAAIGASTDSLDLLAESNPSISAPLISIRDFREEYLDPAWSDAEVNDGAILLTRLRTPNPRKLLSEDRVARIRDRFMESNRRFFADYVTNADEFSFRSFDGGEDYDLDVIGAELDELIREWPLVTNRALALPSFEGRMFREGWKVKEKGEQCLAVKSADESRICFRVPYRLRLQYRDRVLNLRVRCTGPSRVGVTLNGADLGERDLSRETIPIEVSALPEKGTVDLRLAGRGGIWRKLAVSGLEIEFSEQGGDGKSLE